MVDVPEVGKSLGTGTLGGLGADMAEGNGLDIASNAVGDAVSTAREVLAGVGLELPFTAVVDVIGVVG